LVGLRPVRHKVRLDSSIVHRAGSPTSPLLLVHCYGLGGSGFTISHGLAIDAVLSHLSPFLFPGEGAEGGGGDL
jgi:hypothetical protein